MERTSACGTPVDSGWREKKSSKFPTVGRDICVMKYGGTRKRSDGELIVVARAAAHDSKGIRPDGYTGFSRLKCHRFPACNDRGR